MTIHTLTSEPSNVHALDAGLYFVEQGNSVICIIEHQGVKVVHQYDKRGPSHDMYYEFITVEWSATNGSSFAQGAELDFNTIDDARNWIDAELDIDVGFDAQAEWGLTLRDVA